MTTLEERCQDARCNFIQALISPPRYPLLMSNHQQETRSVIPVPCLGGERRTYHGFAEPFVPHVHDHYVIGHILEGERRLQVNGDALLLRPGDIIAFNPGDAHGCCQEGSGTFAYDSVTLAPELLEGATLVACSRDAGISDEFASVMDAIERDDETEIRERALSLAVLLEAPTQDEARDSVHSESAHRIHEHLYAHATEKVSIQDLAQAEGLSEYALIRAYRKQFHITPTQNLISLRVERACALLAQGVPPAQAAVEVGFADQAHLTREFKKRMGFTPAAYGKMMTESSERA